MAARPRGWRPGIVGARRVERRYSRSLLELAQAIGRIVLAYPLHAILDTTALPELQRNLDAYAEAITPWSEATARRMLADVNIRDLKAWGELSAALSHNLKREIDTAPTGLVMRQLMADQVGLIKSIPRDAGERVHQWVIAGIADGRRADSVTDAILRSEDVAAYRARTIARTETSRAASTLLQARATHVGSSQYIWRTSGDADVRPSHRLLNGTVQSWVAPPVCDRVGNREYRAHPGCIWNCRCWPDPILPEID